MKEWEYTVEEAQEQFDEASSLNSIINQFKKPEQREAILDLIKQAKPLLHRGKSADGSIRHPKGGVVKHTIRAIRSLPSQYKKSLKHILGVALHDIGKIYTHDVTIRDDKEADTYYGHDVSEEGISAAKKILSNFKDELSNKDINDILFSIENHMELHDDEWIDRTNKKKHYEKWERLLSDKPRWEFLKIIAKADATSSGKISKTKNAIKKIESAKPIKNPQW